MVVIPNGTLRIVDGIKRVYYDGYWIKAYDPPADSLQAKKLLIQATTRRLFNHVEHGINIPGKRLGETRDAFEKEKVPARKRVKGAMLAGALFNRATDIFTKLVELQEQGINIDEDNALMRECGDCLQEALSLGRMVLHRSGEEGIDELWGEPFRAFSIPVEAFYESRYIKIAQTLRDIDRISCAMVHTFANDPLFSDAPTVIRRFTDEAKNKCETLRTDANIFDIWSGFVVASEQIAAYAPAMLAHPDALLMRHAADGIRLIKQGRALITYLSRARVTMPRSTKDYLERCEEYQRIYHPAIPTAASA
ncbi:MAG: DUF1987 domain-containing protein [Betaproteobacteria bacterium]|nr:DUF1987 domain-containing protein [Betaproteobacteria bacterium]